MERFDQGIVAIDLGTTNAYVSYFDRIAEMGVCCVNAEGQTVTPSVIHFETLENPIIGEVAKESSMLAPNRTVCNYKHAIGKQQVMIAVDGTSFTAEQLAELQLKELLKNAEAFLDQKCKAAVITVPVSADQKFMQAVMDAGKNVGLEQVYLINEVIASVSHYDAIEELDGKTIVVFDLGGGTLDIAVAHILKDKIEIVIFVGKAGLGGNKWDQAIASNIKNVYLKGRKMSLEDEQKLILDVERAKKILSRKMQTRFILSTCEDKESITLTREEFETYTKHLLEEVKNVILELKKELEEKGIKKLDKIYMVGGSSKMPQIQSLMEQMFPDVTIVSKNPDEAVALGAAVYTKRIRSHQKEIEVRQTYKEKELKTVSAKSYGIAVQVGEEGEKKIFQVIPRGTELPIAIRYPFYTKEKNQKEVTMKIYETMSKDTFSKIASDMLLGTGYLQIQKKLPKHSKVWVKFSMDVDGMLVVEGVEEQGKTKAQLVLAGSVA